eukprot:5009659-Karenia_brevis.AAC.1
MLLKHMSVLIDEHRLGELGDATKFNTFAQQVSDTTDSFASIVDDLGLELPDDMLEDTGKITIEHAKHLVKEMVTQVIKEKEDKKFKEEKAEKRKQQ